MNFRLTAIIRTNFLQMIQNRFFLILATISSISLVSISVFLIPQAVKTHRYNKCIDTQLAMRFAINPGGEAIPGKLNYLKAVEHCEGFWISLSLLFLIIDFKVSGSIFCLTPTVSNSKGLYSTKDVAWIQAKSSQTDNPIQLRRDQWCCSCAKDAE